MNDWGTIAAYLVFAFVGCLLIVFGVAEWYLFIRPEWRARAQALMTLMTNGVGNFTGYLITGWWFAACARPAGTQWSLFWGVLATAVAAVLVYFLTAYHGREVIEISDARTVKVQRVTETI